ncbi:hypothetical protein PybrP1_001550 [[Pythium] brassicae (nom. inval.)]|nr:hypothetical protein PybrP1_001550 [[Pythium] brassicae (nom. inval.)]
MTRPTFLELQPDWYELADGERCWLDVSERSVQLAGIDADADADEGSGLLKVEVHAPPSSHFELELSTGAPPPASSSQTPHFVEIVRRERDWIEVHAHVGEQSARRTVRTVFQAPAAAVAVAGRRQLLAVDVSRDERVVAVGGADGHCAIFDALARTEAFNLPGHFSDVTSVRFFPSSKVLLSASLDFTLRIWNVEDGLCAAVLKGHRGGVEDTAILGRGRNDVIAKWGNDAQSAVHCLSVLDDASKALGKAGDEPPAAHSQEAETEGKVLFAGLENGETLGVDIRMRQLTASVRGTAPILSCAATSTSGAPLLFTGSEDGILATWDLRHTSTPLQLQTRSGAPIHSIALSSETGDAPSAAASVWTAHGDGVCCHWSGAATDALVSTELSGPQFDPVRGLAIAPRTGRVFTVGRDGLLRDYNPHLLT